MQHIQTNRSNCVPLYIYKIDSVTGTPLAGAVFELLCFGRTVCRGTTNARGLLTFHIRPCSALILREAVPPSGYNPNENIYQIFVDNCGNVRVNGTLTNQIVIEDTISTATFSFTAIKVNSVNSAPLAGATYTLYSGGLPVATTVSTDTGAVTFTNLSPGEYELVETEPPAGFRADEERLPVVVAQDGSVTILGEPANGFLLTNTAISAAPVINLIVEDDVEITGTGIPGAEIVLTFPNGSTVTATVTASGTWTINVPANIILTAGEVVSAVQIEPGKAESNRVSRVVIGEVIPIVSKDFENLSTPGQVVHPGDLLEFTILVGNEGSAIWHNAVLIDDLGDPNIAAFVPGTVRINGVPATVGTGVNEYIFNAQTNTLTIYLGDILPGEVRSITYRQQINPDTEALVFQNNLTAFNSNSTRGTVNATVTFNITNV